ncbi:hypothetical protein BH23GEM11_BH23GEM11_13820 [soil metagenome]
MKKLYRSALVAGVLALGVAACGDDVTIDDTPPPAPVLNVTMTPSNQSINVGETADFAVGVSGGATGAQASWTCSSSASGVASVATTDTGCRATGAAAGNASITVTVTKGNQSANAGAQVTVTSVTTSPATISISSITQGGDPVDIENIEGQVDVTLNVDARDETIQRVVLYVDGVEVASQTFTAAMAAMGADAVAEAMQQITLSFRTDFYSIDEAAGTATPRHLNGDRVISAALEVVGSDANRPSNSVPVRFNNDSGVHVLTDITTKPAGTADTGELWYGGPDFGTTTITALPVNYDGGTVSTVRLLTLCAVSGNQNYPVVDTSAPFTFSRTCVGTQDDNVVPTFSWVRDGNTEMVEPLNNTARFGLSAHPFPVRIDRIAPVANGAVTTSPISGWFGSNTAFAQSGANLWVDTGLGTPDDTGVGNITYQYQYTTAPATGTSTWTTFTSASELPETDTNESLAFRVRACDALLNCTTLGNELVGSDQTPPVDVEYTAGSPKQGDIIMAAGEEFVLTGADALSGPLGAWGTLRRLNPAGTTTCVVGSGTACNPSAGPFVVPTVAGYYTFSAVFRDVALNTTAPDEASRTVVYDMTAPQVVNVNVPLSVTGGAEASFSATATDNLDLQDFVYKTGFASFNLPHGPRQNLGTFGAPLLQQASLSASVSFIRSLELPGGAIEAAQVARFEARDFGNNVGFGQSALIGVPAAPATSVFTAVNSFAPTADPTTICVVTDADNCGSVATTTALEAVVDGESGSFAAPFARIIFYRNDSGVLTYIGETTTRVSTDDGSSQTNPPGNPGGRVWTYSGVTFTPMVDDKANPLAIDIHAVGVTSAGHALLSTAVAVTVN